MAMLEAPAAAHAPAKQGPHQQQELQMSDSEDSGASLTCASNPLASRPTDENGPERRVMMQTQHPLVQIQQISPPPHMMLHQHQLAPTIAEVPQTLQPRMLKEINGFQCKEDLLCYVSQYHTRLDAINLVTSVYRLAKMFGHIRIPEHRAVWKQELIRSHTFIVLLRGIQRHLHHRQVLVYNGSVLRGIDARCVSNLCWALVKLELADNTEKFNMGAQVIEAACPLVGHLLPTMSSQGLANLLWALARVTNAPLKTMMAITTRIAIMLHDPTIALNFDAQALSNAIWALAHLRSKASESAKVQELDAIAGVPGTVLCFMEGVACCASVMLQTLNIHTDKLQQYMVEAENKFSCQAMVNLVWSCATLIGEECANNPHIHIMFMFVRQEAVLRLHATAQALQQQQAWAHKLPGGLNEQALSNLTFAYDKTNLLDRELLQWIFCVAAFRLDFMELTGTSHFGFKPQELCTLLRAAHTSIAPPWAFLSKLAKVMLARPSIINGWSTSERHELNKAFMLLCSFTHPLRMQQMMHQQQQQQQQQTAYLRHSSAPQSHYQAVNFQQQQRPLSDLNHSAPPLLNHSAPLLTTSNLGLLAAAATSSGMGGHAFGQASLQGAAGFGQAIGQGSLQGAVDFGQAIGHASLQSAAMQTPPPSAVQQSTTQARLLDNLVMGGGGAPNPNPNAFNFLGSTGDPNMDLQELLSHYIVPETLPSVADPPVPFPGTVFGNESILAAASLFSLEDEPFVGIDPSHAQLWLQQQQEQEISHLQQALSHSDALTGIHSDATNYTNSANTTSYGQLFQAADLPGIYLPQDL